MNPVREFLQEKRGGMFSAAKHVPRMFGDALMTGAATAAAGGAMAGVGYGAQQIFNAATKGRDFRQMLMNNPDLVPEHEKDPKSFNQLFTSLRNVNPSFSRDPIIAGSYMRRMVGSPAAGGVLTDALGFRDKEVPGVGDAALVAGQAGIANRSKKFEPVNPLEKRQLKLDKREMKVKELTTKDKIKGFQGP